MKIFFNLTFFSAIIFVIISCAATSTEKVEIKWKVSDSTKKNFLMQMNNSYKSDTTFLDLFGKNSNTINISLINPREKKSPTGVDTLKAFTWTKRQANDTLSKTEIYNEGLIKNGDLSGMAHLLLELPNKEVSIGDSSAIKDTFLYYNPRQVDSSFKRNRVTLIDLKKENNETVAFIRYDLHEYFSSHDSLFNNDTTTMEFIYNGLAKFSVEKGRWNSYNATSIQYM